MARRRSTSSSIVEIYGSSRVSQARPVSTEQRVMDFSEYLALVRNSAEFRSNMVRDQSRLRAEIDILEAKEAKIRNRIDLTDVVLGKIPPWLLKPKARPAYMHLTEAERAEAEEILSNSESTELLAERNNIEISPKTLKCLRDREWLNDEVINFYFDLLNELRPKLVFCWNSFFWLKLSANGYAYSAVRRWTSKRKINVFSLNRMLVPMNIGKNHWALGLVDFKRKKIAYFDSLSPDTVHSSFAEFMLKYLADEFVDKKASGSFDMNEWSTELVSPPQQSNSFDCGVFTCMTAECLVAGRDKLDFNQDMIADMRRKMTVQIARNKIRL